MARTAYRSYSAGRVVLVIAEVIAGLILLGVLLVVLDANQANMIVNFFMDIAKFFAKPFDGLFAQPTQQRNVLVNWTLAAVVYFLVGLLVARLVRRA